jgi:hypothetical protein
MADAKPVLGWSDYGPYVEATVCDVEVTVWHKSLEWQMETGRGRGSKSGAADSLLDAQLAAESAALQWLTEGVTALGGHVITRVEMDTCIDALGRRTLDAAEVALCVEALRGVELHGFGASSARSRMDALARKLGGG